MPTLGSTHTRFLLTVVAVSTILWIGIGPLELHAYGLLAGAWGIVLVASHRLASRGLDDLQLTRHVHPSAFEGDAVRVRLELMNRGAQEVGFLEFLDRFGPSMIGLQRMARADPLAEGVSLRIDYIGSCSRRWGIYGVGPLRVRKRDPLGLFETARIFAPGATISIFPHVYELAPRVQPGGCYSHTPQETSSDTSGESQLYTGLRDYRAGDEPRRIHWPATARQGSPIVKEFESDRVPYFTLFLDLLRDRRAGTGRKSTREFLVRSGASLLWTAVRRRQFIQVFADDGEMLAIPPGNGTAHLTFALHRLIQVQQGGTSPLVDIVMSRHTEIPMGSTAGLVFATATPDLGELGTLIDALTARRVLPVCVFIDIYAFAPVAEWHLPAEEIAAKRSATADFLASCGTPAIFLDAEDDLAETLPHTEFSA